jgi:hypothetical protein
MATDAERLAGAEVLAARLLALDRDDQLMLSRGDVAGIDALHTALPERFELVEGVDVMRDELAIDLDPNRIQPRGLSLGEGDEDGDLRVRREEKPLLEAAELRGDAQDVRLYLLDLLVEALHLLPRDLLGDTRRSDEPARQGDDRGPGDRAAGRDRAATRLRPAVVSRRHGSEGRTRFNRIGHGGPPRLRFPEPVRPTRSPQSVTWLTAREAQDAGRCADFRCGLATLDGPVAPS